MHQFPAETTEEEQTGCGIARARSLLALIVDLGNFVDLPAYVFGSWQGSCVTGINSSTELAGQKASAQFDSPYQAFLLDSNGVWNDVGPESGYTDSFATAINDSGQVAGVSQYRANGGSGAKIDEAFLYIAGKLQDLGTLGGNDSYAMGINNSGQVVGYSTTTTNSKHRPMPSCTPIAR